MTTAAITATGSFVDWMLGFDQGWDHAKYGDTFDDAPQANAAYLAGWAAGVEKFYLELADLLVTAAAALR